MARLDETIVDGQTDHLADHMKIARKANYVFDVTDFGAVCDGANNVTVTRAGSDTYDDAATVKTLATDGAFIRILSVGDTEWKIVDTGGTVT